MDRPYSARTASMLFAVVVSLLTGSAVPAGARSPQGENPPMTTAEDEAKIRSLFDKQGEAWVREDGEAFASVFAVDADFVNIRAHALRGRAEIARHHTQIFTTIYRGSKVQAGDLRIKFIRPDVATIEASSKVTLKDQSERHAHMLAVAVASNGHWEIQALHNMVPFVPPTAPPH